MKKFLAGIIVGVSVCLAGIVGVFGWPLFEELYNSRPKPKFSVPG